MIKKMIHVAVIVVVGAFIEKILPKKVMDNKQFNYKIILFI